MKMTMTALATWFLVLGGIVLGYEAVLGTNLLHALMGGYPVAETLIAAVIGVCALYVGFSMIAVKK